MKKILLSLLILFLFPFIARAAVLYFDPAEAAYGPGDEFAVSVKLDVNTGCINTIEAEIEFPREQLLLKDFIIGESIISIWLDNPSLGDMPEANKNGRLYFAGGIPGGYCGKIPGDPGDSNILGRLVFQLPKFRVGGSPESGLTLAFGEKTRVLQNDGFGTADPLITREAAISLQDKAVNPDLDWDYLISRDQTPPEPFVIELHKNGRVYEGRYYLIFNAVDKQSGIDHYEVLEIRPGEEAGTVKEDAWWERILSKEKSAPDWVRARMPYVLIDQELGSIIKVRAVDRAGNIRLVEYIPPYAGKDIDRKGIGPLLMIGGLMIIALLAAAVFLAISIFKKLRSKPHEEENN